MLELIGIIEESEGKSNAIQQGLQEELAEQRAINHNLKKMLKG